jgi:predicted transcriptional regulator
MIHIDPASTEFESLSRQEQARLYRAMGWTVPALADEFGVVDTTIREWTEPNTKERRRAATAKYRASEAGRAARREQGKRRHSRAKAKAEAERAPHWLEGYVYMEPDCPAFAGLPRQHQARIYAANGLGWTAIARKLGTTDNTVRYWVDAEFREWKRAYARAQKSASRAARKQEAA